MIAVLPRYTEPPPKKSEKAIVLIKDNYEILNCLLKPTSTYKK